MVWSPAMDGPLEAVFGLGVLGAAAAIGALAANAIRIPPAVGALASGIAVARLLPISLHPESVWPVQAFACAWLCLILGMELDLRAIGRAASRSSLAAGLAHAASVFVLGAAAAWGAGLPPATAGVAGLCLLAGSPLATIAVTATSSARGALTRRLHSMSAVTFAAALAAAALAGGKVWWQPWAGLTLGCVCGAVLLIPLSRTVTRGGHHLVAALGCLLIVLVSTWLGGGMAWVALLSLGAGLVVGHLTDAGDARLAMRDVSLPAVLFWFALSGARLDPATLIAGALGGVLMTGARAGAAFLWFKGSRGGPDSWLRPMAALPTSAGIVAAAVAGSADGDLMMAILLVATAMTEVLGMAAARTVLAAAREAVPLSDEPDAWRASMR
ncbi:MAG: hypothetical protein ACREAA_17285 [Candidatus Polarisedimenticolia bacterium]